LIPFFVADRPASLKILRGSRLEKYDVRVGVMSHANTSRDFQELFSLYPCVKRGYCEVVHGICPYDRKVNRCPKGLMIKEATIKMCDSGIFQKGGCSLEYSELFSIYENMNAMYGIIIDYLKQKNETITSAEEALTEYEEGEYTFQLVGVAQGANLEEYVECYNELRKMGYSHIAVGGLLKKRENSVRYVKVGNEQLLRDTLSMIRDENPKDWLFALGCYSPKRHDFFSQLNIYGTDYKGWIFNYDIGRGRKDNVANKSEIQLKRRRFQQVRKYLQEIYLRVQHDSINCKM
jgi:hypothetical protein